ncbi:MAG: hypothetical protein AAFV25_22310 [Bacteroidota bacterium]
MIHIHSDQDSGIPLLKKVLDKELTVVFVEDEPSDVMQRKIKECIQEYYNGGEGNYLFYISKLPLEKKKKLPFTLFPMSAYNADVSSNTLTISQVKSRRLYFNPGTGSGVVCHL